MKQIKQEINNYSAATVQNIVWISSAKFNLIKVKHKTSTALIQQKEYKRIQGSDWPK